MTAIDRTIVEISAAAHRGSRGELWRHRELIYFLALRDIKVRYKQTLLGVVWAILQPLLTMLVFYLLFARIAKIPTAGVPAPVFYFCALVPWIYFSSTVSAAGMSLVANANLLTKIYFPRIILPMAAAVSGLLDLAIGSLCALALAWYHGIVSGWNLLLWPMAMLMLFALALGLGTWFAAVNVKYRDVKYALPFFLQLLLFATPIIYPASLVPNNLQWLVALNPLAPLIELARFAVIPQYPLQWQSVAISSLLTLTILGGGIVYFRRTESTLADLV